MSSLPFYVLAKIRAVQGPTGVADYTKLLSVCDTGYIYLYFGVVLLYSDIVVSCLDPVVMV
jgi:hypothetical protein